LPKEVNDNRIFIEESSNITYEQEKTFTECIGGLSRLSLKTERLLELKGF